MVHVVNIKYSQILENYSYSKIKDEAEVLAFLLLSDYGRQAEFVGPVYEVQSL